MPFLLFNVGVFKLLVREPDKILHNSVMARHLTCYNLPNQQNVSWIYTLFFHYWQVIFMTG